MPLALAAAAVALLSVPSALTAPTWNKRDLDSCVIDSYTLNPDNGSGIWPYRSYQSSDMKPPQLLINKTGEQLQRGLIFFVQENSGRLQNAIAEEAAFIMTDEGDLIYGIEGASSNFHSQTLFGQPVISLFAGDESQGGHGYGSVRVFDPDYEQIYNVCPQIDVTVSPGTGSIQCVADGHESYITENNTMLVPVYNLTRADLTSVGGPQDGWVRDSLAVEVDLNTNETLFVWDPLLHVPINGSHSPLNGAGRNASDPYDFFHINSIQSFRGGYLINSRGFWTTYFVNRQGEIEWSVNGVDGGDFGSLPEGASFSWEHDARIQNDPSDPKRAILSWFADNNFDPTTSNPSIGLSLGFTYPPSKNSNVTIETALSDPSQPISAFAEGANRPLANGNYFVGYGVLPVMKEYGPQGDVRWSGQFGVISKSNSSQSYRAYKEEWHATPSTTRPSLVVRNSLSLNGTDALASCAGGSTYRGFVSWSGATDVTSYNIYAGNTTTSLSHISIISKMGFETGFVIPLSARYVQVGAVEKKMEVSKSDVVPVI